MSIGGHDVAFAITLELVADEIGVGRVADAEEHGAGGQVPLLAGLQVAQTKAGDLLLVDVVHVVHDGVGQELDLVVLRGRGRA